MRTCSTDRDLLYDLEQAVNNQDLNHLLQVFGENGDMNSTLLSSVSSSFRKRIIYALMQD